MTLRRLALRAVRWNIAGTGVKGVIQITLLLALSRVLSPHDLGVVAAIDVLMAYALVLADGGFGNAIIQHTDVDDVLVSTVFWISTFIGLALAIVTYFLAPLVDEWFRTGTPEAFRLSAFVFMFAGLEQLFTALMQKELRFKELSVIEALGAALGLLTTVVALWFGARGSSYVYGLMVRFGLEAALKIYRTRQSWKIYRIFRFSSARSVMRFGLFQLGESALDKLALTADRLFIGPMLGPEALGTYYVAVELTRKPGAFVSAALAKIAYPLFSATKADARRLQESYITLTKVILMSLGPVLLLVAIFPAQTISIAFGSTWVSAAPIVRIFAILNLLKEVGGLGGKVLLSFGRAGLLFTWKIIWVPLLASVCYLGIARGGVFVLTYAIAVLNLAAMPVWHLLIAKVSSIDYRVFVRRTAPVALCLAAGAVAALFVPRVASDLVQVAAGGTAFAFVFVVALFAIDGHEVRRLILLLREDFGYR